jgi:SpoIIAA-like
MIKQLSDLPAGVIGFQAAGTMRAEDYRDVVIPAVEGAAENGEIRFLIVIDSFDGMTGGALWQDLKLGTHDLRAWKRIALVTDIDWMTHLTAMFGWMTPGQVRHFPLAQRDAVIAWVTE